MSNQQAAAIGPTIRASSKSLLWGISIAMSWMWGIGLFISVQIAVQFGIQGLLSFAVTNALGLALFGAHVSRVAKRHKSAAEFERFFFENARKFRGAIFFYQILAVIITLLAVLKYLVMPLGYPAALVVIVFFGVTFFLGEEFDIARIKYSHAFFFAGTFAAMAGLLHFVLPHIGVFSGSSLLSVAEAFDGAWKLTYDQENAGNVVYFLYYMIPIAVGFLLGPWLDLQQWQRAVQIRREGASITGSFICGSLIFFSMLIFHGVLALAIWQGAVNAGTAGQLLDHSRDGLFHAKTVITKFFNLPGNEAASAYLSFYIAFICLCAIATCDSGYLAIRWFLEDLVGRSQNIIFSIVPQKAFTSPLPWFFLCGVAALGGAYAGVEVEYLAAFYASFLVCYQITFYRQVAYDLRAARLPGMKIFAVSLSSIAFFGIGYFSLQSPLMAIGSVAPLLYGIYLTSSARLAGFSAADARDRRKKTATAFEVEAEAVVEEPSEPANARAAAASRKSKKAKASKKQEDNDGAEDSDAPVPVAPGGAQLVPQSEEEAEEFAAPATAAAAQAPAALPKGSWSSTYFDGKWFVHTFTATYCDTNSVGNVYFGTYAMWVGKARELFFHKVLPEFDRAKTDFLILTRAFEHKFLRESREFDNIEVRLRIADYNRKFATLEHQILDDKGVVLGKGKQTLLFVSAQDYRLLDIPQACVKAFISYT
jgi:acyl-CoA thioesterase FadM